MYRSLQDSGCLRMLIFSVVIVCRSSAVSSTHGKPVGGHVYSKQARTLGQAIQGLQCEPRLFGAWSSANHSASAWPWQEREEGKCGEEDQAVYKVY